MQIKLLKDLVEELAGVDSGLIVEILFNKKDVNEFLIAKKMDLTINQVRNILYKLSAEGLVSFIRKKDKRKGWYIYYWTLNTEKCLIRLEQSLVKKIEDLKNLLGKRESKRFYVCETCDIEVGEETALEHGFTCEECAEVYTLSDKEAPIRDLKTRSTKTEKGLSLIQQELGIIREKLAKKKAREEKKRAKEKEAEKLAKKIARAKERAKLKKKTEAKIIYDVHEDVTKQILSKHWIPKIFRKIISNLFNLFEKWVSKKLDYIITATPNIKSNFKQNNVIDIKNYPILSLFPKEEKKKEANSKKYIELIYVGGLSKERGIKKIIKSLKYINSKYNVKLTLIGKFSEKKFEEEIKSMAEWNSINFLGFLPQKKAYQHMNNANIGLICFLPEPNHINAIPNKIFEYMINKLPIIASDFPLWKEIIEKNDCGFCVDPKKPKKIAETIEHFIKHPEQAKQMRENGQKAILKRYNWEKESKKLLKVYKKLLK